MSLSLGLGKMLPVPPTPLKITESESPTGLRSTIFNPSIHPLTPNLTISLLLARNTDDSKKSLKSEEVFVLLLAVLLLKITLTLDLLLTSNSSRFRPHWLPLPNLASIKPF